MISTQRLRKTFGSRVAVDNLDLEVPRGSVFGFLGPNGAGKTTTIMMLLGMIRPTSGQAWLLGKPVGDIAVRRRVGFLPERFQFHDFLTPRELLHLHGRLAGMSRGDLDVRVPEALELVGLADRSDARIRTFSKGMQQRIGLAQAVLHEPELVILDEPTSAMDPIGRVDVRRFIERLRERGTTVFLNSHLLSEIEQTCDQVAILREGVVVAQGTVESLLAGSSRVEIETRGLSETAWARILAHTPGVHRDGDRLTAPDCAEEQVAALARAIVESSADLVSVIPRRETLEELFVRVIGCASGT
jgi:ABC-2 type transport system ATP-binding protein